MVEKLKDAGALIVGKTNLDEFGMGYASSQFKTAMLGLTDDEGPTLQIRFMARSKTSIVKTETLFQLVEARAVAL